MAAISPKNPLELFEKLGQLGQGSYGIVIKAQRKSDGVLAAAKLIDLGENGDELEDIQNEIAMLEACKHENIVGYFGAYLQGKTMWIAMEFCGGGSVSDIYGKLGHPLSEMQIAHITYYSFIGLDYLHQNHMVHRDIKGGNILLTNDGKVKLADLGVSAKLNSTMSKRKSFIGTPYWIAPEIIAVEMKMGPDGYTSRCDIWSMGITCIEMAEMQPPMFDLHPMRALYLIPKNPPPKLMGKGSKDFREMLAKALTKNPAKRPSAALMIKIPFFKQMKNEPSCLRDLVESVGRQGASAKKHTLITEFKDDQDEEGGATADEPASKIGKRLASEQQSAQKANEELAIATISGGDDTMKATSPATAATAAAASGGAAANGKPDSAYDNWAKPMANYVPIGQQRPGGMPQTYSTMPAADEDGAATEQQSSFVLSNVFAGCPLKVLCAASWNYLPAGREPCLYIIVGADSGLYVLETSGEKRELVQVSKRRCSWLYVMDEEGMMISVSGEGLVCVHDLNSLLVGPGEDIKFKTTKLVNGAKGGRCAVTQTPDTKFTFLCVAISRQLMLMQWYAPRKKFMKLKDFTTPFDQPPKLMELLVLPDEPLPVLCVGATRDKKTREKQMSLVNPNYPPETLAKHMSAELGWVRVRAGREDVFATAIKQVGLNRFMLCFSNVATFVDSEGNTSLQPGYPDKIVFEEPPETVIHTRDAVIGFSEHRMERRSIYTGKITHQMKDKGERFRVVGKEGNIIIETRAEGESSSHLYLLHRK